MVSFIERLTRRAVEADSLLCVGLDPREPSARSARDGCLRLIDATVEFASAFKANSAFFEVFGAEGWTALKEVREHVPTGIPFILDAKRGDISDTAEVYARVAFDLIGADAVTVSPYLGGETLAPFLDRAERGAFVLCKTSNPGADEFQALDVGGETLYERVAEQATGWNSRNNVGLVVGATDHQALAGARERAPDLWFLVPGVGAQGGAIAGLRPALKSDGLGLLVSVSRSLAQSADPGTAARRLRDQINSLRATVKSLTSAPSRPRNVSWLARDLFETGCVKFGEFKLKSGLLSPIYLDLRRLVSYPAALRRVAREYSGLLKTLSYDRMAGIPYAGLPIATAIALENGRPLIYPRREAKEYGTRAEIEGEWKSGETVVVIDDLATTGRAKIEAIEKLEAAGMHVRDVVVLIDREQGAGEMLQQAGYRLHSVTTLRPLLDEWHTMGAITREQYERVSQFLEKT